MPRRRRYPQNALTSAFVRRAKAGRHCDGNGLYLDVQQSGSRSWIQRIVIRGRRREIGLGGFPVVPLDDAREEALKNRRLVLAGRDPVAEKQRARPVVKLAFEFLVLTAVRSREVRAALWSEMDAANAVWTIPAERMKGNRERRVPLCPRALNLLAAARVLESWRPGEPDGTLVFPTARGGG